MTETEVAKWEKYASTEKYRIIDAIGVPHPYCITTKHVAYAADHCGGLLGPEAMREAEKEGAVCEICQKGGNGILLYDEHKQALLVECNDGRELSDQPELHAYLLSIKAQAEADGFAGFAFVKAKGVK